MARFKDFLKEFALVLVLVVAVNLLLTGPLTPALDLLAKAVSGHTSSIRSLLLPLLSMLASVPAGYMVFQRSKDLKMAFTTCALASGLAIVLVSIYSVVTNFAAFSSSSRSVTGPVIDYLFSTAGLALGYFCLGLVGGILGVELRYRAQKKKIVK